MMVNLQSRFLAQPFILLYVVGILLLPIAAIGCAGSTCENPSVSGTSELKLGDLRKDILCPGGTVRVSLDVEGNHFYTMIGEFSGSLLGNNKAAGRIFGSPIPSDVEFEFTGIDQLVGILQTSFFAQSSGTITVEATNQSAGFAQGEQGVVSLLGDLKVIETQFRVMDSGVEDHGERPEDASQLPTDGSVTTGALRRGDELDFFRLSVEAGQTYRLVFEATSNLRLGTARVDRFEQFNAFVPSEGGTEFSVRARAGIVESRDFTARTTEDILIAVAKTPTDPVELLSLFALTGALDRFPIDYAVTVSLLGAGALGTTCKSMVLAPPIDWELIETRAEGVFDVSCLENTLDNIFLKYVQRDPDVIVELISSGTRVMILHNPIEGIQEVFLPGSNIGSLDDVLTDIQANPMFDDELKASFHAGALKRARQSRFEIEALLDPKMPTRVTGYSLGGSVAVIFSLYLELDGFEVSSVLTFGQFPITDETGVRLFADQPLLRIKSGLDGVPDLFTTTYTHFGDLILLLDGPLFVYLTPDNNNFSSATADIRAFDPFVGHATYLDRLQGKLLAPAQVSFCDAATFITDGVENVCP